MDDRRQFIRLGSRVNATYKILDSGDAHHSVTRNVSSGGLCLFTETQLNPGKILEITMQLPDCKRSLKFTAEVVWSGALILSDKAKDFGPRAFETGVRYTEISSEDHETIKRYTSQKGSDAAS